MYQLRSERLLEHHFLTVLGNNPLKPKQFFFKFLSEIWWRAAYWGETVNGHGLKDFLICECLGTFYVKKR